MQRLRTLRYKSWKARWLSCVERHKNWKKPRKNFEKKSKLGRKSMNMSNRSTSFTRKVLWQASAKINYWKLQLEDCNMNLTSSAKSIRSPMMSWSLSSNSILKLRESQGKGLKRMKKMLEHSWREFQKMDKALRKDVTQPWLNQWTKVRARLSCCQISRLRPLHYPKLATNLKAMLQMTLSSQQDWKAFHQETRTKTDFSLRSTIEPIQMQLAREPIWLAGMLKERYQLRISSSANF